MLATNGLGYEYLRGLAPILASTHQTENPRGLSELGESKQLLIAIVVASYFIQYNFCIQIFYFPTYCLGIRFYFLAFC